MDPAIETPAVDPGELAKLVVQLRELRAQVDGQQATLPSREETPFLYRQLDEQISALTDSLRRFSGEPIPDKKPGLLGRVFGRSKEEKRRYPDLEGNSWTIPVAELVGFLSNARKTGILWVDSKHENFVIEIKEGDLVRATSDGTPERMRLGELLVSQGTLKANEVSDVVREAKEYGLSLGGYLIQSGRTTEQDVARALGKQVQDLFHRLLTSGNAIYRFQEGVDLGSAKELDLNVMQLLLESARHHDEKAVQALAILDEAIENTILHDLPEETEADESAASDAAEQEEEQEEEGSDRRQGEGEEKSERRSGSAEDKRKEFRERRKGRRDRRKAERRRRRAKEASQGKSDDGSEEQTESKTEAA